jgi:hypothetical protein
MAGQRLLFKSAAQKKPNGASDLPRGRLPQIELEDPNGNVGAQMIPEAVERTGEAVGGRTGTNASAIHAHAVCDHRGGR